MATKQKEVEKWITVNGVHVPVFKGQSVEEAVKKVTGKTTKTNKPVENTMENRNKLKKEIDDYVKAHPNPTEADRKKVSEMRDKYNAMKAEAYKKKPSGDSIDADQKKLNDLHSEYYKLYKHDEDNIPGRDAKLNELEKQIHETEGRIRQKKVVNDNEDLKAKQIEDNEKQAKEAAGKTGSDKTSKKRTLKSFEKEADELKASNWDYRLMKKSDIISQLLKKYRKDANLTQAEWKNLYDKYFAKYH